LIGYVFKDIPVLNAISLSLASNEVMRYPSCSTTDRNASSTDVRLTCESPGDLLSPTL
jgi:hypothetical protein